jgi:signal transduction histidine kinase
MREGAYDFLPKPVKVDQFNAVLGRCREWILHKRSHAELQEVNRRLLELTRIKEKFLVITDHELRTPVTVIDGMLHMMLRRSEELPEGMRSRLEALSQISRRLVELVRGIHELARSRASQLPVSLDRTTAEQVAQGVLLDFEIARFNRSLELELVRDVAGDLAFQADLHRVRQAVTELIHNAVKATPDGGRQGSEGARFCVGVSDTGVGIPEKEQGRVFEAFYEVGDERHHHTSKYEFMGSGLGIGLTLALEIARTHEGGIDLVSRPGEGATFTFWVPC